MYHISWALRARVGVCGSAPRQAIAAPRDQPSMTLLDPYWRQLAQMGDMSGRSALATTPKVGNPPPELDAGAAVCAHRARRARPAVPSPVFLY